MIYTFILDECDDLPTSVCCRTMGVSTSGFYAWRAAPISVRDLADAALTDIIFDIHVRSRRSYGSPRVWLELRLGERGLACSPKRVERLMREANIVAIHRRKGRGCTVRDPAGVPSGDLVDRKFVADGPDRLWLTDITEHPTGTGKVYLAAVLDVFSRRIVGWSIADHLRTELVTDALQMALWRRQPSDGQTVLHSDHGTQFTSWMFGRRLRAAGLLGSMGSIGGLLRQLDDGIVFRNAPTRAAGRTDLGHPPPARHRDLRMDRGLVQPLATSHLDQRPLPGRVRDPAPPRRNCGVTPHPNRPPNRGTLTNADHRS